MFHPATYQTVLPQSQVTLTMVTVTAVTVTGNSILPPTFIASSYLPVIGHTEKGSQSEGHCHRPHRRRVTEHQPHCQTVTQVQFIQALLLVLCYINTHTGSTQKNILPHVT